MNKVDTKPNGDKFYKRDKKGQFSKVHSLLKKIAMAKAQGVPHVPPGPTKKVPPPFSALKNPAAKKLGHDLYMRKKAGEFNNDHAIYLAAAKLASQYKKAHPSASGGMSANQIVNAYKRHEYDEVGYVTLLGQISGNLNQLDRTGPGSDWKPAGKPDLPSKPTIDKTKTGLNITSSKFSKPDTLKPTGQSLGGVTGVKVYVDSKGVEWAVKTPKSGSNAYGNKNFMVDIEIAASRLQNKAGLPVPAMHEEEVDGKHSAVSKMYKAPDGGKVAEAFPKGKGLDIATMSQDDILDLQRNQVFDWLISNHDTHSANFLRTETGIVGIDKGQAFKFFGQDKLDYNYQPVMPLDGNVSVYQRIWKQFAQGKGELIDPNSGELKGTIERIQSIPDDEYRKLLRPYATKAAAGNSLSMPNKPYGASKAELVSHFLDEAVKRKNNLAKDFGDYYAKVKAEHDNNKPNVPSVPSAVAAKAKADNKKSAPSGSGSSSIDQYIAGDLAFQDILSMSKKADTLSDIKVGDNLALADSTEIVKVTSVDSQVVKYDPVHGGFNATGEFYKPYVDEGNVYILPDEAAHGSDIGAKLYPSKLQVGLEFAIKTPEGKYGSKSTVTQIKGDSVTIQGANGATVDVEKNFFAAGNFYITGLPSTNAPELNKPIKSVAALKAGDKIQSPWGSTFTVTDFGSDSNGSYVETANANGDFAGNIYDSSIADAAKQANAWSFVGNINEQGSVDANDLAGQPISDINSVIPGDKIVYSFAGADISMTVKSIDKALGKNGFVMANKDNTGAAVALYLSDFQQGKIKYAYASGDFKPLSGKITELDIFAGDEVQISDGTSTDTGKVHFVNTAHGGEIEVTVGGSNYPINFTPVMKNGVVSWVDDPQSFLDGDIVSQLGKSESPSTPKAKPSKPGPIKGLHELSPGDIVTDAGGTKYTIADISSAILKNGYVTMQKSPGGIAWKLYESDLPGYLVERGKPKNTKPKIKIEGELAKDLSSVDVGDFLVVMGEVHEVTYTSLNGIDVKKVSDGEPGVITPSDFASGYVSWGANSASQKYPSYPDSDLKFGPFTNETAPGTTLKKLSLPGWGGYVGQLSVGDEVVGFGANGELKKGSVVQSAGGPMNVYVSWDDDPTGDWVEFTHTGQGGFWGDGSVTMTDDFTLVGKKQSSAVPSPGYQKPIGPSQAPAAASTPIATKNTGKAATFDDLDVGTVYHVPGLKMQKVISKDADSFVAQSVSGSTHTYPKEKFNTWAANKGAVIGVPGLSDDAPDLKDVAVQSIYVIPADPFDPSSNQKNKYSVKAKTNDQVDLVNVATGQTISVKTSNWESETKGWKNLPGLSDWEKYSQGLITWEEYQETNDHKESIKLHSPEGPAAPGKPSPASDFAGKKTQKITEKKPPPPWSAIKGAHVKDMGAEVYELKKSGSLTTDHELYLACGKVIRAWKKKYPEEKNWPSNNQLRHAARRLEFEENGSVVWETEDQKTAKQVPEVQTKKSVLQHKPSGKYTTMHDPSKLPLTSFGDSKKLAGSYQNPVNFGPSYSLTDNMVAWGNNSNPQIGYPSGEKKSIEFYTGSGAGNTINPYLRTGSVGYGNGASVATHVKNIDAAMAKSNPVEDWTICTRGSYGAYDVGIDHSATIDELRGQIGKTVLNKGYSSTSLGSKPAFGGDLRIIYRVPPGLKGLWVSGDGKGQKISSCGSSEREFILPRNLKIKVIAVEEHKDGLGYKHDVVVEIVGWEGQ